MATSSAALVAANNSIEEQVAMLSAGNATMQDVSTVAAGLKIVAARLRGTTTDIDDDAESAVTNVSKLQSKVKALTAEANGGEGIDIINEDGSYKSTYQILSEISKIFDKMDDVSSAALLELIAGKNRSSVIAAILQNGNILEEAYKDAFKADGSSQRELDTYLSSIQGRVDLFTNALQTMWMNLISSDEVKWVVDRGTGLIQFFDSGAGKVTTLSAALLALGKSLKALPFTVTNNQFQILGKSLDTIKKDFEQFSTETNNFSALLKSIFTTPDVGGIDLSSMLSEDDFNTRLNGLITGFNNLDQSVSSISWEDYVKGVSKSDEAMGAALNTCNMQNGAIVAGENAYQAYTGAATGAAVGNTAVGTTAKMTTAQLIGLKIAALAANAALTLGLSLIMTSIAQGISKLANAEKEAAEAAIEAAEAAEKLDDVNKSLDDYKDQIKELRKELDDNTLSESEAYNAREQLLKIQNELIDKFGLEKDGINLVTGAINDQIAAIDKLSQQNAQDWINQNQDEINRALEFFNSDTVGGSLDKLIEGRNSAIDMWGQTKSVMQMVDDYASKHSGVNASGAALIPGYQHISFVGSVENVKSEVESFMSWLNDRESDITDKLDDLMEIPESNRDSSINKQIESLKNDLQSIKDMRNDISSEYKEWFGENSTYAANKAVIEQLQKQTALTEKYATEYAEILEAQNALTIAQAQGDNVAYDAALTRLQKAFGSAIAKANGTQYMVDFFEGMREGYESESKLQKLKNDIRNNLSVALTMDGKSTNDPDSERAVRSFVENILGSLEDMNAKEILQLGEIDPNNHAFVTLTNLAQSYGLELKELLNVLVQLGYIEADFKADLGKDIDAVKTYSALTSQVENYKDILSQTSEVISNNTEVTEDYKESLSALGISSTDLAECFDSENKLLVTNADRLHELVKEAKSETAQNIKLAKSQAQLKYYDLVKQINSTLRSTEKLDDTTRGSIETMLDQADAVKLAIYQYQLLEDSLLGVANAFEEFDKAKEVDALNAYGDSFVEMAQTMYDAFYKTGQVGSEAFWAAVEATVPDSVYNTYATEAEKLQAIFDYVNSNVFPTLTMEDDNMSLGYENIADFIHELKEAKVIVGDASDFSLVEGMDLETAAELMRMTTTQAYALFAELDKYNGSKGVPSLLMQLDSSTSGQLSMLTFEMEQLNKQKLALLSSGGYEENKDAIDGINNRLVECGEELIALQDKAYTTWQAYTKTDAALAALDSIADKQHVLTSEEAITYGIALNEGELLTVQQAYDRLLEYKIALEEPTVITATLAIDKINSEIANLESLLENADFQKMDPVVFGLTVDATDEEIKAAIEEKLQALKDEKAVIVTQFNIELTEEEKKDLEQQLNDIETFKINDKEFTVTGNGTSDVLQCLIEIRDFVLPKKQQVIETVYTEKNNGDSSYVDSLRVTSPFEQLLNGVHANGTAHASGDWGLPTNETNSLVGELGPELVVDPYSGRYYTVGDNGAEMVNLKKGSIIFNHKQTEQLLKNGHINSRGKAYASGNAHFNNAGWVPLSPNDSNTFKDEIDGYVNNFNENLGNAGDSANEFADTLDGISILMEEFEERISNLNAQLENATTAKQKNSIIDNIIRETKNKQIKAQDGRDYYDEKANEEYDKIDYKYKNIAENGAIAIKDLKGEVDEKQLEYIQKYRDYAQKAADLDQQAIEAVEEMAQLSKQKFDNIAAEYDTSRSLNAELDNQTKLLIDINDGVLDTSSYYDNLLSSAEERRDDLESEKQALESIVKAEVAAGNIKVGSDEWNEMRQTIEELDTEILQCSLDMEDLAQEKFDAVAKSFENKTAALKDANDMISAGIENMEKDGFAAVNAEYNKMIGNVGDLQDELKLQKQAMQDVLDQQMASGNIKLNSDEYYEMKAAIDAVAVEIENCNTELEDLATKKLDTITSEFERLINVLEGLDEYSETYIDLNENLGYEKLGSAYDEMMKRISNGKDGKIDLLKAELKALEKAFDSELIPENSEAWYEYQETIQNLKTEILACDAALEDLAKKKFDSISNQFENERSLLENENEQIKAQIDLLEEKGEIPASAYYEELKNNAEQEKESLQEQRDAMQAVLDKQVELGNIKIGTDQWYEMINAINDVDAEIVQCDQDLESFQNSINDLHWENFDELINRYDYISNEAQNMIDLMSEANMHIAPDNEDGWSAQDVKWTNEGLAVLGLYAQQMEIAEQKSKEYAAAIEELNAQYDAGRYSEIEYLDKLNELRDAQYDSIEAYQKAKDSIADLNKARVDSIKNGINKQVEALEKLINKKKELLSADQDAYKFQKNIENQQKDIAAIQRQIDALALDNSASARAKKAQLEAELAEKQMALNEAYYDRSLENQQNALDQELEDFKDQKDAELEKWDKYLEDVENMVKESLFNVQLYADEAYVGLTTSADNYGVTLSDSIKKPWEEAAAEALKHNTLFDELELKAGEYGMTLAQFLSTPWEEAKDDPVYQELYDELNRIAENHGHTITDILNGSWTNGTNAIGLYDEKFGNTSSKTLEQLESIKNAWEKITDEINAAAQAQIELIKNQEDAYDSVTGKGDTDNGSDKPASNTNKPSGSNTSNSNSNTNGTGNSNSHSNNNSASTSTRSEEEKYGVALAIWNGNHGWGVGNTRVQRLTSKGFDAQEIQKIVDDLGEEGLVHSGAWIGHYFGIRDLAQYNFNKYAKGTAGVKNDQLAWIDEMGLEELVMHAGPNGKLTFLSKGSSVIPADLTKNLMSWGELDPREMLDRSRPHITAPHSVNNEINISMNIAEVVHVDNVTNDTLPELTKVVRKEMDSYMTRINNAIKAKVR